MPSNLAQLAEDGDLTVDMLSQYAYCPRRFHLMYVQGRWDDNTFTEQGKSAHRRVDQLDHVLPDPDAPQPQSDDASSESANKPPGDEPPTISRSIPLSSSILGLSAKLDLVSTADDEAAPVETKRGSAPENEQRSHEPQRVQLMAQGLLLREHGYRCDHGVLYFAASRTRVDVPFNTSLEQRTMEIIGLVRAAAQATEAPPPLDDSPKCPGCSLAGICLPDETLALTQPDSPAGRPDVRRLFPIRDDALPLYVQEQGAIVAKRGLGIVIRKEAQKLASVGLKDVSQLVLCGNVSVTPQTVNWLCQEEVPIVHMTTGHWFCGLTTGITLRNSFARAAQYQAACDETCRASLAKKIVAAKGANQRTMLRRNASSTPQRDLDDMTELLQKVAVAESCEVLLGLEGNLAARYYANFARLLSPRDFETQWDFTTRNRRPPKDPVNAMLSFGYAMLAKECTVALLSEGLDPWWGMYHRPRHGRPALALDLMEEFRPLVVDSAVITAVNTGMVTAASFVKSQAGCLLNDAGRKALIRAYEARLDQLVTHPVFDYRCSWRSIIRLQCRMLGKWLFGDIPEYSGMTTR
ncbi:MAG: CRISPR-associated endonuclease Cas1, partial [Planctomycetes bacterium]|jgi:CRISPR-associated protein Cas1|nr:CRISPR-associated endonuclease Cas1 [Planctomycetota bacterium]